MPAGSWPPRHYDGVTSEADQAAPTDPPRHPRAENDWRVMLALSFLRATVICASAVMLSVFVNLSVLPQPLRLPLSVLYIVFWVIVYVGYFRHQYRLLALSRFPGIRAGEALIVGSILFVTAFANVYHLISEGDPGAFSERLDLFTSYYYTVTVLGTVGFGDITPTSVMARSFSMVQMFIDLGIIAVSVRILTRGLKQNPSQRAPGAAAS